MSCKKLQTSNARIENAKKDWETTFDAISDLISIHDNDFRIIRCNKALASHFNVKPEDLIGKKCHEVFHGADEPWTTCPFVRCKETHEPVTQELDDPHMDGSLLVSCFPRFDDESGKLSGIIHIARDITKRKRMEDEIKKSLTQLRRIIEKHVDGIIIVDQKGTVCFVNLAGEYLFGRKSEELVDKDFGFPVLSGETSVIRVLRKGGETVEVEMRVVRIEWEGKDANLLFLRELTDLQKASESIRKLSHAVEQSPSVVVITDVNGNIEYANPKFLQNTGYNADEVTGENPRILKSGETSPEVYKRLWETITSGGEWRGELHNRRKDGKLYWESATISPIKNPAGVITNFIKVAEDITERKKAEEELKQSLKKLRSTLGGVVEAIASITIAPAPSAAF